MVKLKQYREKAGLKTCAVAEKLKLSRITVWAHEKGTRTPNVETLKQYAKLYNCKIDDLINYLYTTLCLKGHRVVYV